MADRAAADPKITFAWNSEVVAMQGESKLESITLRDTKTGEERQLEVAGVFEAIGHDPRSELVRGQVDLDDAGYVVCAEPSTRTNVPGVSPAATWSTPTTNKPSPRPGPGAVLP